MSEQPSVPRTDCDPIRVWVVPGIYPYPAHTERWKGIFIHRQVQALRAGGTDVRVVQSRDAFPPWPLWKIDRAWRAARAAWRPRTRVYEGVPVFHPVVVQMRPSRVFRRSAVERTVDRIVRFLQSQGARPDRDVILAHWLIPDGYIATRAARRLGLTVAVKMWGDDVARWPHQSSRHLAEAQWAMEHATTLIACSECLAREAAKLSSSLPPVTTIYTSLDLDAFKPADTQTRVRARREAGIPQDAIAVLSVGSALRRKGWLELLDAIATLRNETPRLVLVAVHAGAVDLDLRAEASNRHLTDRLIVLDERSPEQLAALYQAADIFALASHREGLANVVLEAMASGLPVVTTSVGGHAELIESGISGELVPPQDTAALVVALRRLLQRPESWREYGRRARVAAERVGSPVTNAARLLGLLENMRAGSAVSDASAAHPAAGTQPFPRPAHQV